MKLYAAVRSRTKPYETIRSRTKSYEAVRSHIDRRPVRRNSLPLTGSDLDFRREVTSLSGCSGLDFAREVSGQPLRRGSWPLRWEVVYRLPRSPFGRGIPTPIHGCAIARRGLSEEVLQLTITMLLRAECLEEIKTFSRLMWVAASYKPVT